MNCWQLFEFISDHQYIVIGHGKLVIAFYVYLMPVETRRTLISLTRRVGSALWISTCDSFFGIAEPYR